MTRLRVFALLVALSVVAARSFAILDRRRLQRKCKAELKRCNNDGRCCGDLVCGAVTRWLNKQGGQKVETRCISSDAGAMVLGSPPACTAEGKKCKARSKFCCGDLECKQVPRYANSGNMKMEERCVDPTDVDIFFGLGPKCVEGGDKCNKGKNCCDGHECVEVTRYLLNKQGTSVKEFRCIEEGINPLPVFGQPICRSEEQKCDPPGASPLTRPACCGGLECQSRERVLNWRGDTKEEWVCADPSTGPEPRPGFCIKAGRKCKSGGAPCCSDMVCNQDTSEKLGECGPVAAPTASPSLAPAAPTAAPSVPPTLEPTSRPAASPTAEPSFPPTPTPITGLTTAPSSARPIQNPTSSPSLRPTRTPVSSPSAAPAPALTAAPSRSTEATASPSRRPPTRMPVTAAPVPAPGGNGRMTAVVWDANDAATIEFCQVGNSFGYRLPGETTCEPAGVVVRMQPGVNYVLTLYNAGNEVTNIHTHGLHIGGDGNGDDITRVVSPGMCLQYHWSIPQDHMGGTFWMHGHRHGAVERHAAGGAYSMLIIEENSDLLANVNNAADRSALLGWMNNELLLIAADNGVIRSNGAREPQEFALTANEWYRLRILTFRSNGQRESLVFPQACQVHATAWDGVWKLDVPGPAVTTLNPTGAGRTDVAIQCGNLGTHTITYNEAAVSTLRVSAGNNPSNASPFVVGGQTWRPGRPYYLRDLSQGDNSIGQFQTRTVTFRQRTINGAQWNVNAPLFQINYNTLQEWTIVGTGNGHTLHNHVYHMQTFGCNGHEDGEYYDTIAATNRDCRVRFHAVDCGGRIVMHCVSSYDRSTQYADVELTSALVSTCNPQHNIAHEDEGMMVWYNTIGGPVESREGKDPFTCAAPTRT